MRSPVIQTKFTEATSRYGHMGTCLHFPAYAEAWFKDRRDTGIEITSEMYPGLEAHQLTEKAAALLRASTKRRVMRCACGKEIRHCVRHEGGCVQA